MKKHILFAALLTLSFNTSWSQINFEKGYFIDESNQKVYCLIRNVDPKNNPTQFRYKLSKDEPVQSANIETVKEFGLNGYLKFVRADVKIDVSKSGINELSLNREPEFKDETVFLKVLVEGNNNLYSYHNENTTRYFYKTADSAPVQLIYKKYMTDKGIATNDDFKKQLLVEFQPMVLLNELQDLYYNSRDLEQIFVKLNKNNNNSDYTVFEDKKRDLFNLSIRPGINFSTLSVQTDLTSFYTTDFDMEQSFRFGVEAELILPFYRNKWGLLLEPAFQYYQSEHPASLDRFSSEVNYQSFEFAGGVRHYFFLTDKSKLYLNVLLVYDYANNSTIKIIRYNEFLQAEVDIKSKINMASGIGYRYKDKYSIEMRYYTSRDLLYYNSAWFSSYHTTSVTLGYTLF
jgi:hypothetical protein